MIYLGPTAFNRDPSNCVKISLSVTFGIVKIRSKSWCSKITAKYSIRTPCVLDHIIRLNGCSNETSSHVVSGEFILQSGKISRQNGKTIKRLASFLLAG